MCFFSTPLIFRLMNKTQKGFALLEIALGLLLIFLIIGAGWIIWSHAHPSINSTKTQNPIASYGQCAKAGYPVQVAKADLQPSENQFPVFECIVSVNKYFFNQVDRCKVGSSTCGDVHAAFNSYCQQQYASAHGVSYLDAKQFAGAETKISAAIKSGYARTTGDCLSMSGNQTDHGPEITLFLQNQTGAWKVIKVINSSLLCKDMDGLAVPADLMGSCYDEITGGFRAPA